MTNNDLAEIRLVRRQISKECHDQPEEVFDYYEKAQQRLKATGNFTFVNRRLECANADLAAEQTDV